MNAFCECPAAGFCKRHQKIKGAEQFARCKGTASTPDCGLKYWNAWEAGSAGAIAPENPVFDPPGFCGGEIVEVDVEYQSSVGDMLAEIIKRETGHPVPCGDCQKDIDALNSLAVEECREKKSEFVRNIYLRSYANATALQKLGIVLDKLFLAGITVGIIEGWFDEALEKGVIKKKANPEVSASELLRLRDLAVKAAEAKRSRSLDRMSGIHAFRYRSDAASRFISSEQLHRDVKHLASMVPSDVTTIAGVARSGLAVASMLAMYLHLPLLTMRHQQNDVVSAGHGWRLARDKPQGRVLIVDDTVMTGNSIKSVRPIAEREFEDYLFATVYCNPAARQKPDLFAVELPWPHILEWNVFNSVMASSIAVDFDGILCHDCPAGSDDDGLKYLEFIQNAKPLYLPRREPVPLIVTARIEKYRRPTEEWLQRHGVRFEKLVMHSAATLRERQRDNIAAYKAKHFREWLKSRRGIRPFIFFESDDQQARQIASRVTYVDSLVVCPSTAGVY